MPTLLRKRGYVFRFNAADEPEPPHVHVAGNDGAAKVWLEDLSLAFARGYTSRQLRQISRIVTDHQEEFLERWREFFG